MTLPVRIVSEQDIRKVFTEGKYLERLAANELIEAVETSKPARAAFLPIGSESQMIWYFDAKTLRRVALVHQYLLPDGSIGASGLPDPKRIILESEILQVAQTFKS